MIDTNDAETLDLTILEIQKIVALLKSPLRMYLIDLNMPLGSMIVFMVKWLIASVIAFVLVTGAIFMVGGILMTILGLIGMALGSN